MTDFPAELSKKQMYDQMSSSNLLLIQELDR